MPGCVEKVGIASCGKNICKGSGEERGGHGQETEKDQWGQRVETRKG